MTGAWITDIRHFLDEHGQVPHDLPPVPRYMGAIVKAASCLPTGSLLSLHLRCRRRPEHRRCPGEVHATIDPSSGEISWSCPCCGDHGLIYNWEGSPWDRGLTRRKSNTSSKGGPVGFSPRATAAWNAIPQEIRVRLLNNFWCSTCRGITSVDLKNGSVSQGDLILRGNCTQCGGEIARLVEDVGRP